MIMIIGPCVIEDDIIMEKISSRINNLNIKYGWDIIFKASYDKANRSSINSFRGPGLNAGLKVLKRIKEQYNLKILTDVHSVEEVEHIKTIADFIQIPAFLSRQTDLIIAAAQTGKTINIKKGQFLSPYDVSNVVEKVESTNNNKLFITERGVSFGYNNLVVDMTGIYKMQKLGYPVIFDATHSIQKPGGGGGKSSGNRDDIKYAARAAIAAGADGIFIETHPNPELALSDGANMLKLEILEKTLVELEKIYQLVKTFDE